MFIPIVFFSITSALCTFHISKNPNIGSIRASSGLSLISIIIISFLGIKYHFDTSIFNAAIFGGSFVGMSSSEKFSYLDVFIATCIFSIIFILIVPFFKEMGGALGFSAFISTVLIKVVSKKTNNI